MMKPYFSVRTDDVILCVLWYPDPDAGPGIPKPPAMEGTTLIDTEHARTFTREGRTDTEVAYWRDGEVVWVEILSLPDLKLRKRAEITQDRLAADSDRFEYQGKEIRTAEKDILDLLIADARWNKGKPLNWPGGWKTIDESYIIISTKDQWDAFFVAMYDAGIDNFMWSQQLKARLEIATTAKEVAAIKWSATPPTIPE